ncbi:DMT family transporter [Algihabitans albus]|uniref:DMT family transporter n=1 Tax=Algihabitans albus TaxID=2164067 RepID=UPI000E5D9D4F|nr:DMT family transporter [Algihabitans albus]
MTPIRVATSRDAAKLVALGAIWGSAFMCIEVALQSFSPLIIAVFRIVLAAVLLLAFAFAAGLRLPRAPRDWVLLTIIGLFGASLPFLLISWGQQHIQASMAAILMGLGPFAALLLNHAFTSDDRLTLPKLVGMSLGFAGIATLVGLEGFLSGRATLLGQLAVLGASFSYALSGLLTRGLSHLDPRVSAGSVLLSAALYLLPVALLLDPPWQIRPSAEALAALIFLGLVSSGFAYLLRFQLIKDTGAVYMSQVSYLVPVFGVFWAWLFLGELPREAAWIALVLVLLGINVSRLKRRRPQPSG